MNPEKIYPIDGFKNTVLLKPLIEASDVSNVFAGEYSYYSNFNDPTQFLTESVLYNFGISKTSLRIGKFCAFAHGVKFVMADANHSTSGITSFPFAVFGEKWAESLPLSEYPFKKYKDIVIGNDVWLGMDVTIMPGVSIGHGSIVGAQSVVASDVPPYSIVAGNPARVIRDRYSADEKEALLDLQWWNWEIEKIELAMPTLVKGNVSELIKFAQEQ
ncbi:CatB-related O-acetyltransferase [Pelagicoccus mobilis]|uniref:CatB-related O-acetyltransferase n=1 Tax=Pelagicoccus mobilis TaxID=415221 RepID=A0A934RVI9_9BACT|nr:CatB-related O-acetyltransferase [Pelagicoccus mobilis]MBK1876210.1 CatB-related O-acetyltransferase [Pelagicoccus mobilis]